MNYTYTEKLSRRIVKIYTTGKIGYHQYCKLIEMYWAKYGKIKSWTNRQ